MALIKCPECEKEISDKAPACINCGFPIEIIRCYECDNPISASDLACSKCGAPLIETTVDEAVKVINGVTVNLKELAVTIDDPNRKDGLTAVINHLSKVVGLNWTDNMNLIRTIRTDYCNPIMEDVNGVSLNLKELACTYRNDKDSFLHYLINDIGMKNKNAEKLMKKVFFLYDDSY